MREIKFRAWDLDKKQFTKSIDGVTLDGKILDLAIGTGGTINRNRNVELMQYTGLKDKNGKEVYEGDILYHKWLSGSDEDEGSYGVVELHQSSFMSKEVGYYFSLIHHEKDLYKDGKFLGFEVVGNIYENPELLT